MAGSTKEAVEDVSGAEFWVRSVGIRWRVDEKDLREGCWLPLSLFLLGRRGGRETALHTSSLLRSTRVPGREETLPSLENPLLGSRPLPSLCDSDNAFMRSHLPHTLALPVFLSPSLYQDALQILPFQLVVHLQTLSPRVSYNSFYAPQAPFLVLITRFSQLSLAANDG